MFNVGIYANIKSVDARHHPMAVYAVSKLMGYEAACELLSLDKDEHLDLMITCRGSFSIEEYRRFAQRIIMNIGRELSVRDAIRNPFTEYARPRKSVKIYKLPKRA